MRKNNMKTPEEKEKIIKRYLNGENIAELVREYQIGHKIIYKWLQKYEENGIDGLKSNTGKHNFISNHKGIYYELTMYFDAWNKEIVGYGLVSRKGDIRSYYDGLNQVLDKIKEEQIDEPVILHTDQGSVYSSKRYNNLLNDFNIQRSMSRAGTPTDNPVNESLNGWIKEELFIDFDLKHSNDVPNLIKLYIDYYNNERPSYALKYKTPIQYKIESGF